MLVLPHAQRPVGSLILYNQSINQQQDRETRMKSITSFILFGSAILLSACVAAVPIPASNQTAPLSSNDSNSSDQSQACDANNPVITDLSTGTHKATLEDGCQLAKLTIVNENQEHAKKCNVYFGSEGVELYIPVGETRIVSHNKPIKPNQVSYGCKNDWNKPK